MKKIIITVAVCAVIGIPLMRQFCKTDQEKINDLVLVAKDAAYNQAREENAAYQKTMDDLIGQLNDSIVMLNQQIELNELTIQNIKKKQNEKNSRIAKFSTMDITKHISDLYKDSIKK